MNAETTQEKKNQLSWMEKQLRLGGQKLDSLWMQARTATGQAKTDIHNQIGPLREKQNVDRKEHEALKKSEDIAEPTRKTGAGKSWAALNAFLYPLRRRRSNRSGEGASEGSGDEDLSAGPKE